MQLFLFMKITKTTDYPDIIHPPWTHPTWPQSAVTHPVETGA